MTPEIEEQVVSLIEAAKSAGSDAASFIAQQAPDVLNQIVRWSLAEGLIYTTVGVFLLTAGLVVLAVTYKNVRSDKWDEVWWLPSAMVSITLIILGGMYSFGGINQTAKTIVAPKVVIIETLSKAIQKR